MLENQISFYSSKPIPGTEEWELIMEKKRKKENKIISLLNLELDLDIDLDVEKSRSNPFSRDLLGLGLF